MTHYYDTKLAKIISEESDGRMDGAIISYIVDKGWDNVKKITDAQIDALEGNGLMTKEFVQSLVRAARRITNECDQFKDFFPYIRMYMGIDGFQTKDLTFNRTDYEIYEWEEVVDKFDIDYDESPREIESIDLVCIVDSVEIKED